MDVNDLIEELSKLVQLDIDAAVAYEQAVEQIEVGDVRDQLEMFAADHERHIAELSDCIMALGGEAPERPRDFAGFLTEGFTISLSGNGTEAALRAMRANEQKTNKRYAEALTWDLPGDVRDIVERNGDDEMRHLRYLKDALEARIWEEAA